MYVRREDAVHVNTPPPRLRGQTHDAPKHLPGNWKIVDAKDAALASDPVGAIRLSS